MAFGHRSLENWRAESIQLDDRENMLQVVENANYCHIGCINHNEIHVVPVNYIYDDGCIYGHSTWNPKVGLLRENPFVCFQVEDVSKLTPWRSVIAWGHFEELTGDDAARAMRLLIYRLADEGHAERSDLEVDLEALLETTVVYRIKITQIKGSEQGSL